MRLVALDEGVARGADEEEPPADARAARGDRGGGQRQALLGPEFAARELVMSAGAAADAGNGRRSSRPGRDDGGGAHGRIVNGGVGVVTCYRRRVRRLVTLACLLVAGRALADGARVRWSGVAGDGHAPATLEKASAAHIAVALKQLGLDHGHAAAGLGRRVGQLHLSPRHIGALSRRGAGVGRRARAETRGIPFHDAEDLAESLALIVADVLTAQFPEVLAPQVASGHARAPAQSAPTPMAPAQTSRRRH